MKKFVCVLTILVMFSSVSFADIRADKLGENVIGNILGTLIMDALKKNGMDDILKDKGAEESSNASSETEMPTIKTSSTGEIIELSEAQYQSFSEICLAGSFEEFQKKIEYENISPDAKFTQKDGSIITLFDMASSSPNKELAAFLKGMKARNGKAGS